MHDLPASLQNGFIFQFEDPSFEHLWLDLDARKPSEVAFNADAIELVNGYIVTLIGADYFLDTVGRKVIGPSDRPMPDRRLILSLVYYLLGAQASRPTNTTLVPETVLPGGGLFFAGVHALNRKPIINAFGSNGAELIRRAEALGGHRVENEAASFSFGITLLPKVFTQITLCEADDEFGADLFFAFDPNVTTHVELSILSSLIGILNDLLTENLV